MDEFFKKTRLLKWSLIVMPLIIVVIMIADVIYINQFNSRTYTVTGETAEETAGETSGETAQDTSANSEAFDLAEGNETETGLAAGSASDGTDASADLSGGSLTSLYIDNREDSTSSWQKNDFDLNGQIVDLNAQTFDTVASNHSDYQVEDWSFTLHIKSDCFINQAWCGTVEIHQNVGKADEKVQTLDLRNYDLDSVLLDYKYDGDLLIPLYAGDYIIYHPSEDAKEMPMAANSETTIGFILYFLDRPDLTDYTMDYQYHREYTDCRLYYAGLCFTFIWLFLFITYLISRVSYQAAVKEMEMKKSGISAMSDIYSIIYIIDLKNNELIPVVADKESEKLRPKEMNAHQQLRNLFDWDCTDLYRDAVLGFCDLATISDRIGNKETIVCEYVSRIHGWCQLRFFAMDRNPDNKAEKLIFTIQVIDEEKEALEELHAAIDEKTENIISIQQKILVGLANIIENRDNNTGGHVKRTSDVVSIIVNEIQRQNRIVLNPDFAGDIVRAAPMHDLGKISIDSSILCKPGRLTAEEFEIMKTHSSRSGEMVRLLLDGVEEEHFVNTAFNIARHHHERWDGKGYPDHLAGNEIPIEARIMAIADVYDALVSKRCYKEAMSYEQAYKIMLEGMGSQFDPGMKEIFLGCHEELEEYYKNSSEE